MTKKELKKLADVMKQADRITEINYIQSLIKDMANEAASQDDCFVDFYMELRNSTKIKRETQEDEEYEIIDISEDGNAPQSMKEVFERALSKLEQRDKNKKAFERNIHTLEYELNSTICLKILDVINKELIKEKELITKSIKSKISLF